MFEIVFPWITVSLALLEWIPAVASVKFWTVLPSTWSRSPVIRIPNVLPEVNPVPSTVNPRIVMSLIPGSMSIPTLVLGLRELMTTDPGAAAGSASNVMGWAAVPEFKKSQPMMNPA